MACESIGCVSKSVESSSWESIASVSSVSVDCACMSLSIVFSVDLVSCVGDLESASSKLMSSKPTSPKSMSSKLRSPKISSNSLFFSGSTSCVSLVSGAFGSVFCISSSRLLTSFICSESSTCASSILCSFSKSCVFSSFANSLSS